MKKILVSLIALVMCNVMSWGTVNISVSPKEIDFGTVQLKNGEAEDYRTATLTWSGIIEYCGVFVDTVGAPDASADYEFYIQSTNAYQDDYWYAGDNTGNEPDEPTVTVGFYAVAAGEYSIKYKFYSYENDDDWYYKTNKAYGDELTVKVKVVDQATGIDETQAKVESRKELRNGQVLIMRKGEVYSVTGERL